MARPTRVTLARINRTLVECESREEALRAAQYMLKLYVAIDRIHNLGPVVFGLVDAESKKPDAYIYYDPEKDQTAEEVIEKCRSHQPSQS